MAWLPSRWLPLLWVGFQPMFQPITRRRFAAVVALVRPSPFPFVHASQRAHQEPFSLLNPLVFPNKGFFAFCVLFFRCWLSSSFTPFVSPRCPAFSQETWVVTFVTRDFPFNLTGIDEMSARKFQLANIRQRLDNPSVLPNVNEAFNDCARSVDLLKFAIHNRGKTPTLTDQDFSQVLIDLDGYRMRVEKMK
jgi:hypothetical protein